MVKKQIKEGIYCAKCNVEMKKTILPEYEYIECYPIHNVEAFKCPECNNVFFTEEQTKELN